MRTKTSTPLSSEDLVARLEVDPELIKRSPLLGKTVRKVADPEGWRSKKAAKEIQGQKFNRILVLEKIGISALGRLVWKCRCDCGVEFLCEGASLRSGNTKSCGCLKREKSSQRLRSLATHGHSKNEVVTPTYRSWSAMWTRCSNPNSGHWEVYGGRGISVCERWRDFSNFLSDMGERPKGRSIERKDVNGNYCPENCVWATCEEQANNRRGNVKITAFGKTMGLAQWAREFGINESTLSNRLKSGLSPEVSISTPVDRRFSRSKL